jgi:hypothetical protein
LCWPMAPVSTLFDNSSIMPRITSAYFLFAMDTY